MLKVATTTKKHTRRQLLKLEAFNCLKLTCRTRVKLDGDRKQNLVTDEREIETERKTKRERERKGKN